MKKNMKIAYKQQGTLIGCSDKNTTCCVSLKRIKYTYTARLYVFQARDKY